MMTQKQIEAQLRLFKSYTLLNNESYSGVLHENAYGKGVLFIEEPPVSILEAAIKMYGKDGEKWNQTFHKSFATVRDTDIEILIAQQVIHYFTTYGLESLGLYDSDLVYIPHEQLEIPDLEEDIPMTVIHKITIEQLQEKLMNLLTSGIALSKETISDIMELSDYIDKERFDEIKNREVKTTLYDKYLIAPKNNIEFLRYMVFKATGSTMLIKNNTMIQAIKKADIEQIYGFMNSYVSTKYGYQNLAQIFFRYKDIFLAFKRKENESVYAKSINKIINRVRKLATKYHKPLEPNILDQLTQLCTLQSVTDNADLIEQELNKVPLFRVIRILNALEYRIKGNTEILVKVRNGKGHIHDIKEGKMNDVKKFAQISLRNIVKFNLINRLKKQLEGKTIYMPDYISYTLPQSEKQFSGNIPEGSYVEVKREDDMVLGIHWTNLNKEGWDARVDLDLHAQNRSEQYGWNTSYRSAGSGDFYFSGDITDAKLPNGATEVFYIGKNCGDKSFLLTINNYTANNAEVPFEFIIGRTNKEIIDRNYVVDPNKIIVQIPRVFEHDNGNVRQMTLGFIRITSEYIRFYFNDFALGNSIVTRQTKVTQGAYNYLETYADIQLQLKPILKEAGVEFLDTPYKEEIVETDQVDEDGNKLYKKVTIKPDYNFSLEAIDKETLIKLLMEEK